MVRYQLTADGEQFLSRALQTCTQFGVTWQQLWSDVKSQEAEAARRFLEFDPTDSDDETAKLLGVAVVIQMLNLAASDPSSLEATSMLLEQARLLTEDNITVAAETLGVSPENVRNVLSPGR